MTYPIIEKKLWRLAVFFLFLTATSVVFGQYSGEPVQKDRLIQVLRSKSFQTSDIIKIIAESGVDFKLTPMLESELVAAGARSPVIDAVRVPPSASSTSQST